MVAIFPGNALMTLDEEGILSWEELFTPLGPPPPPSSNSFAFTRWGGRWRERRNGRKRKCTFGGRWLYQVRGRWWWQWRVKRRWCILDLWRNESCHHHHFTGIKWWWGWKRWWWWRRRKCKLWLQGCYIFYDNITDWGIWRMKKWEKEEEVLECDTKENVIYTRVPVSFMR